jgi:FAD/FMN-containing dehydrogenase
MLAGLEHLDERYLKAVGYASKAKHLGRPKMALFGDIVGDDENQVALAVSEIVRLCNARGAEGFIAVSPEARKTFWLDRARTAAIAKHTNAFKINEDVVIPLPRMGDYCDGIERINIELSMLCKIQVAEVIMPSQPSFCMPGKPPRNLSVTSFPNSPLRNKLPGRFSGSSDRSFLPLVSKRLRMKLTSSWS